MKTLKEALIKRDRKYSYNEKGFSEVETKLSKIKLGDILITNEEPGENMWVYLGTEFPLKSATIPSGTPVMCYYADDYFHRRSLTIYSDYLEHPMFSKYNVQRVIRPITDPPNFKKMSKQDLKEYIINIIEEIQDRL